MAEIYCWCKKYDEENHALFESEIRWVSLNGLAFVNTLRELRLQVYFLLNNERNV